MQKKRVFRFIALICCLALVLTVFAGCGSTGQSEGNGNGDAKKETITIRIGGGQADTFPWIAAVNEVFCEEVSKQVSEKTNYEIEWIKAWSGSILKLGEGLEGIQDGLCDIGVTVVPLEPAKLKLFNMFYYMPFATSDARLGAQALNATLEKYPEFTEVFDEYNSMFLSMLWTEPYNMFSTYEVKSLDDLKGKKVGAAGANLTWVEGAGAATVQSNLLEMFTSLQTGVYQAGIQPTVASINLKVYEVAPYILESGFGPLPGMVLIANKDSFASFPEEVQEIILDAANIYSEECPNYVMNAYDEAMARAVDKGAKVYTMSYEEQKQWAETIPNSLGTFVQELNDMGYPGGEIADFYYSELEKLGEEKVRDWEY